MSDSKQHHGLQPTRLLHPWDFPGKSTGVGCHCLLRFSTYYGFIVASQVMLVIKNPPTNAGDIGNRSSIPGLGRSPGGRKWQPTPVFLHEKPHGQRSLVGYSLWGCNELDSTEGLSTREITNLVLGLIVLRFSCRIDLEKTGSHSVHTHSFKIP